MGLLNILLLMISFVSLNAQSNMELTTQKIDTINQQLDEWIKSEKYAGIINLTSIDNDIKHFEAFGYSDIKEKKLMEKDTIVRIYSMTKPIVSVAIMQLVEQGKLKLDSPITDYFPEFKKLKVYQNGRYVRPNKEITLKNLLTHTAGFSYGWSEHPVDKKYQKAKIWDDLKDGNDFVKKISKLPLIYHPGEKWHYSISVDIQGVLIERVTGITLAKYLDVNFFEPLEMEDTSFRLPNTKKNRFSSNYKNENGKLKLAEKWRSQHYSSESNFFGGGGGLVSTASDYYKFAQMLLNGGTFNGRYYIGKNTIDLMTRDHLKNVLDNPKDPWTDYSFGLEDSKFGLGFRLNISKDPSSGKEITQQYSWNGAAGTEFWIDPLNHLINITLIQKLDSDWTLREKMESLIY